MVSRILDGAARLPTSDPAEAALRHVVAVEDASDASQRRAAILAKASQRSSGAKVLVTGGTRAYVGARILQTARRAPSPWSRGFAFSRRGRGAKASQSHHGATARRARGRAIGTPPSAQRRGQARCRDSAASPSSSLVLVVHGAAEVNMVHQLSTAASHVGAHLKRAPRPHRARRPPPVRGTTLPRRGRAPTACRATSKDASSALEARRATRLCEQCFRTRRSATWAARGARAATPPPSPPRRRSPSGPRID